jgi:hypothetical protein
VGKIGVAQFLGKSSSKRGVTLQFLCTFVDLVAFIGSSRTGPREHSKMVFDHNAIEKHQARVVMVVGHAACREVSQTASFLRCKRGVVFVVGKQEESNEVQRRREDGAVVAMVWDMSRFPDAAHLASWAAMCPGQDESGGKRRSGHTRKGNRYVRAALVQAAQTSLGEQYRRLAKRRGSKRAAMAVGHSILVIFYHMMKTEEEYHEKGVEFFQQTDKQRVQRHLVHRLECLGYQVTLHPLPAA